METPAFLIPAGAPAGSNGYSSRRGGGARSAQLLGECGKALGKARWVVLPVPWLPAVREPAELRREEEQPFVDRRPIHLHHVDERIAARRGALLAHGEPHRAQVDVRRQAVAV